MTSPVGEALGTPPESCAWTVSVPEQEPAATVLEAVVKTSWVGNAAGLTVSTWVAAVSPAGAAVTVTVVAVAPVVPVNQKLAALAPAATETDPTAVEQDESE